MEAQIERWAKTMGLTSKSVIMSIAALLIFPAPYNILLLIIVWFFYLSSLEYYVNLIPLPICEALIHIRLFIEFEATSRGLGLGLIVCIILPFARFCLAIGFFAWVLWTLFNYGSRFIGFENEFDEDALGKWQLDLHMSLRNTFKQLNVLIYRLVAHCDDSSIRRVLRQLNRSLVMANTKMADCTQNYRESVIKLTKKIGELEQAISSYKNELEDCKQSKSGLQHVVKSVRADVIDSKESFGNVDAKLEECKASLVSRMRTQFYWKVVSFLFFPFVVGYLMNRSAIWRIKRMISTYNEQRTLYDNMLKERCAQENVLLSKETATEDRQRRLTKQLRLSNEQLERKKQERESVLMAGQTIKNATSFLTQFHSKVEAVSLYSNDTDNQFVRESVVKGMEDILHYLEPLIYNESLTHLTTPAILSNFRLYYPNHD